MSKIRQTLTEKQLELLQFLYERSRPLKVFTINETQQNISEKLGISRQALNIHLRRLKEMGLIRTGRGFIDLTEKALEVLGKKPGDAFIALKIEPHKRSEAYDQLKKLNVDKIYRVTGDIDVLLQLSQSSLDDVLNKISNINGVKETRTYVVIELVK